ncbi:MAG: hypothetical protein UY63_C0001G0035 [Parcubacteria group bacterium GW2011_GWA2_51_10]|nr:MAG: hypothetical protein UY63_C0001G0035 [Parcubacteria group bacterium GW2011_GWA2_51_10]
MAGGGEDGGHAPGGPPWPSVSHYYGDFVRQLLVGAAALIVIGAPFYADSLRAELPFEVVGALILVALAAVTNPWNRNVIVADAIASGVGMAVFQTWALSGYDAAGPIAFVLRQALAILFLVAFYFSVKTLRAMILRQIGKKDRPDEFQESERQRKIDILSHFYKEDKSEKSRRKKEIHPIDKEGD